MKKIERIVSLFLFVLFLFVNTIQAAQMRIDTPSSGFEIGEIFVVDVMLDANNAGNEDVVAADAVIEYETEMLELVNVFTDSNSDSDFYYGYALSDNTFPVVNTITNSGLGTLQLVVALPGGTPILSTNTNARVARLEFRAKEPPVGRTDNSTTIDFVYTDGSEYTQSKVIANDGSGTNLLTSVSPAVVFIGASDTNVPLPVWSYWVLAMLFIAVIVYLLSSSRARVNNDMAMAA